MAEQTLTCAHLSPLSPDALWCHPFKDQDPFILESRPHIYVLGNQPEFGSKMVEAGTQRTRIVLLPKFSETGEVVLVHTATLETQCIRFQ